MVPPVAHRVDFLRPPLTRISLASGKLVRATGSHHHFKHLVKPDNCATARAGHPGRNPAVHRTARRSEITLASNGHGLHCHRS
jgi:hypothetical protein